ncbi:hypothetical protein ACHAPU_010138 [Fusarium lateritium]
MVDMDNKKDTVHLIASFWNESQEHNDVLTKHLQGMKLRMEGLAVVEDFLDEDELALQEHRTRYSYNNWLQNTLDAISFTRSDALTLAQHIPPLVAKAHTDLTAQGSRIVEQTVFWNIRVVESMQETIVCEFLDSEPRWWSSWMMRYRTSSQVMEDLDGGNLSLLQDTVKRGDMLRWLVKRAPEEEKRYRDARPKRPGKRG